MLKFIDPLSAFVPRIVRRFVGLTGRPNLGCIIRPGGLGDLVILTQAALRLNIDIWRLVWIVEKRNKPWCELLKLPFIAYDELSGVRLAARSREGFSWVIDTEQSHGLSAIFAARLTPHSGSIIGFSSSRGAHLYNHRVQRNPMPVHEIEQFSKLLQEAGAIVQFPKFDVGPLWQPEELNVSRGNHVVLVLGGRQSATRAISVNTWVKLAQLAREFSDDIYLVGHPADTKFGVELFVNAPWIKSNLVGRIDFTQVVRLIKSATRVIGVDSGLIHVASFFDIQTTALFVDEVNRQRWSPLAKGSESLMLEAFERDNKF